MGLEHSIKQIQSSIQGVRAGVQNQIAHLARIIEDSSRRLKAVEKKVGIRLPGEVLKKQREDDHNVDLDTRLKSGRDRLDALEIKVAKLEQIIRGR